MKRTPFPGNKKWRYDNWVASRRVIMARFVEPPRVNIVNFPKNQKDLKVVLKAMTHNGKGLTEVDDINIK